MEYDLVREYNIEEYEEFCDLMKRFKGGERTTDVTGRAAHILLRAMDNRDKVSDRI